MAYENVMKMPGQNPKMPHFKAEVNLLQSRACMCAKNRVDSRFIQLNIWCIGVHWLQSNPMLLRMQIAFIIHNETSI